MSDVLQNEATSGTRHFMGGARKRNRGGPALHQATAEVIESLLLFVVKGADAMRAYGRT